MLFLLYSYFVRCWELCGFFYKENPNIAVKWNCRELCLNTQNKKPSKQLFYQIKIWIKVWWLFSQLPGNMQENFDFDLDLCELLLQTQKKKKKTGWYPPIHLKGWSGVFVFSPGWQTMWFIVDFIWAPGFVLFWSDGVQYCSVRDISLEEVLQLQSRADAKGSGMMTPIIAENVCALLDHLSSMPKWTSTHHCTIHWMQVMSYNECCAVISIFKEPLNLVFFNKYFRMQELLVLGLWEQNQNKRASLLLQKSKRICDFMKELMVF